jgi:hypothetical protein
MHCDQVLRYPVVSFERYLQKTEDLPHELRNAVPNYPILSTLSQTYLECSYSFRHSNDLCRATSMSCVSLRSALYLLILDYSGVLC